MRQTETQRKKIMAAAALLGEYTFQWIFSIMLGKVRRPEEQKDPYIGRADIIDRFRMSPSAVDREIKKPGFPKGWIPQGGKKKLYRTIEVEVFLRRDIDG